MKRLKEEQGKIKKNQYVKVIKHLVVTFETRFDQLQEVADGKPRV